MTLIIDCANSDWDSLLHNREINNGSVLTECLVQSFRSLLSGAAGLGNFPFHLAGADLILGNAAGLAGIGVDHRWSAGLQLPCPPRRHQNVPVIAIEAFDQLHWDIPPWKLTLRCNQCRAFEHCNRGHHDLPSVCRRRSIIAVKGPLLGRPPMIPRKLMACRDDGGTKGCQDRLNLLLQVGKAKTLRARDDGVLLL